MQENIKLSVIDVENKYKDEYAYREYVYGKEEIVAYGNDNKLPILLNNVVKECATLNSIIQGTTNFILGDTIECNVESMKDKVNRTGMTIRELVKLVALSYLKFGGFAIQVIYSKAGIPVELYPLDFMKCRLNENKTKVFYAKNNWGKYTTKYEEFDRFDRKNIDWNKPTQIFYYGNTDSYSFYPLPQYYSALRDILTEIECSKYSLNAISRGFSAKYLFNIPQVSNLTDEQKEAIEEGIRNKFCNSENDANFMLYFTDADEKIEIQKIETDDTPERFIAVKDNARENIFIAMRATPNLFGLMTTTTGFNEQEFSSAFKLFQKTVIQPIQDIIEESISKIFAVDNSIKITPFNINFNE